MASIETKTNFHESKCLSIEESEIPHTELLAKFRELIKGSDINYPMSDELLLCFIRARKYDLDRALKLLKNYVKTSETNPKLFKDLQDPQLKQLQPGFRDKHGKVSPVLDQNGRRILILVTRDWDQVACDLDTTFNCFVKSLQALIACPQNQMKGIILIMDFKDFSIGNVRYVTPSFLKHFSGLLQGVFPIRFAGIHFVSEPLYLKILLTILWPFLSQKMRSRMFFHGNNFESLHQHIDPACLPSDYNGQLGSMIETMALSNIYPNEKPNIFDSLN